MVSQVTCTPPSFLVKGKVAAGHSAEIFGTMFDAMGASKETARFFRNGFDENDSMVNVVSLITLPNVPATEHIVTQGFQFHPC